MRACAVLVAAFLFAGCGDDEDDRAAEPPPAGPGIEAVELDLRVDDGEGEIREASLTCVAGETESTGYLADADPVDLCRGALRVRRLLTTEPPEERVCTQIYGGPETAHVTGTLAGRPVDRRFNRENGCRIAEWDRLQRAGLLPGD